MKFREWLKESNILTDLDILSEASRDPDEIVNTKNNLEKDRDNYDRLIKMIGTKGRIPTEEEANQDFASNEFNGVFWKKDKINFPGKQIEYFEKHAKEYNLNYEIINGEIKLYIDDKKYIILRKTGNTVGKTGNNGEVVTSQILIPETAYQESMTAAILQIMAEKTKISSPELSDEMKEFIGEKSLKKISPLFKWFLTSDPTKETGICKYVDFGTDDALALQKELYQYLNGSWINSFESLYKSNVLDEISKVFKNGVSNWKAAKFIHFLSKIGGKSFKDSIVQSYLTENRCGELKDVVDKSDIFLCFNLSKAQTVISQLMSCTDKQEYFTIMNDAINGKDFIGISLKQIKNSVHLSIVNFNAATTAAGPNISDEKKIQFKFFGPNNKKNTLNLAAAKINNESLIDNQKKFKTTFEINIPFYNGKDIHIGNDSKIILAVRSNSSKFGAVTIEPKIQGLPAQMGKIVTPFARLFGYNVTAVLANKLKTAKSEKAVSMAYLECTKEILDLIQTNEEVFYEIISSGVGYPLEVNKRGKIDFKVFSAPYVKIY